MSVEISGECGECERAFTDEETSAFTRGERTACPECGASNVSIKLLAQVVVEARPSLAFKAREHGKGRPFLEQRQGWSLHRLSGTWSKVKQIIDRRNNRYIKHVTDAEGRVTRNVDAALDEHLGHGDDRSHTKAHP